MFFQLNKKQKTVRIYASFEDGDEKEKEVVIKTSMTSITEMVVTITLLITVMTNRTTMMMVLTVMMLMSLPPTVLMAMSVKMMMEKVVKPYSCVKTFHIQFFLPLLILTIPRPKFPSRKFFTFFGF